MQSRDGDVASAQDASAVFEAPALLRVVWADPAHMPEHLALWGVVRGPPGAGADGVRARRPRRAERDGRAARRRPARAAGVRRMAYMLGLIGVGDAKPSRLRTVLGWVFVGIVFVVGFVLPFVWVPYMAAWMRASTRRLGERTTAFYAAGAGAAAGGAGRHEARQGGCCPGVRPGGPAAPGRARG